MRKLTTDELQEILEKHQKWLKDEREGIRANLRNADLRNADLWNADLRNANLRNANLSDADLRNADLRNADLRNADLRNATHEFSICPEEGSFIGFKKCRDMKIVKLLITTDSKRLSATGRKCRASKVRVLDIYDIGDRNKKYLQAKSNYAWNFIYTLGEVIEIKNFNEDRWNECSTGIHFFLTEKEAIKY